MSHSFVGYSFLHEVGNNLSLILLITIALFSLTVMELVTLVDAATSWLKISYAYFQASFPVERFSQPVISPFPPGREKQLCWYFRWWRYHLTSADSELQGLWILGNNFGGRKQFFRSLIFAFCMDDFCPPFPFCFCLFGNGSDHCIIEIYMFNFDIDHFYSPGIGIVYRLSPEYFRLIFHVLKAFRPDHADRGPSVMLSVPAGLWHPEKFPPG